MALSGRVLTVECPCAGTPHEADTVTFRAVLPLAAGVAGMVAISTAATELGGNLTGLRLAEYVFPVYMAHAIEAWTFTGADGEPIPLADGDAVLPFAVKFAIADAADDLFGEEIARPLVAAIGRSSPGGPTASSTPPKPTSGRKRPSRSVPSSPPVSAATGP
jgi:hypothetical protein